MQAHTHAQCIHTCAFIDHRDNWIWWPGFNQACLIKTSNCRYFVIHSIETLQLQFALNKLNWLRPTLKSISFIASSETGVCYRSSLPLASTEYFLSYAYIVAFMTSFLTHTQTLSGSQLISFLYDSYQIIVLCWLLVVRCIDMQS